MAQSSTIEWTDATWNPVTGCSKVSPGCAHCYAETLTARFAGRKGYIEEHRPWTPENAEHNVRLHPERLEQPLSWRKPRMVFVNSMSDLFHELVPDEFILDIFRTMQGARQHVFQILTKRPERARAWFAWFDERYRWQVRKLGMSEWQDAPAHAEARGEWPLPNVWLGVSIENARYTWRADVLREIPAAVRFISAEPLLGSLFPQDSAGGRADSQARPIQPAGDAPLRDGGPADQELGMGARTRAPLSLVGIDWLIVGGESGGRDSRAMHPEWARELRDACRDTQRWSCTRDGVDAPCGNCDGCRYDAAHPPTAFFFKQWGSWSPGIGGKGAVLYAFGDGAVSMYRGAGPKSGGRELDGRTWDEMPT